MASAIRTADVDCLLYRLKYYVRVDEYVFTIISYCAVPNRSHEQIFYKLIFPTRFHNNYKNVSLQCLFYSLDMNTGSALRNYILARDNNTRTRPRNTRQTVMTFSIKH